MTVPGFYKRWPTGIDHIDGLNRDCINLYACFPQALGYYAIVDDFGDLVPYIRMLAQ